MIAVPLWAIDVRSATIAFGWTGATLFSTGVDSPVSVDSSQKRFFASTRRISAVTISPLSSTTMSPGTTLLSREGLQLPFAPYPRGAGTELAQRLHRANRSKLGQEADERVDGEHEQDRY